MVNVDLEPLYAKSNLKFLKSGLIFSTIYGSRAYGTSRPDSDIDVRGIVIPPKKFVLGVIDNFDQAIFKKPIDCIFFGLQKFVKLAMEANHNFLEIIFTDPSDHLFCNEIGESLLDIRDSFLSKKCRFSMAGYAHAQLKKIRCHRSWIQKGVLKKPERKDFDLPDNSKLIPENQLLEIEAQVKQKIEGWIIDTTGMDNANSIKFNRELEDILIELKINTEEYTGYAAKSLGLNDNLTHAFQKERAWRSAVRDYKNWEEWKLNRNKTRHEIEAKYGYDAKNALHLVRLFTSCIEVLRDHKLLVRRPDAEFLLEIRNGKFSYDELIEWAENKDKELDELYKTSTLKNEPERVKINDWLIDVLMRFYKI